MASHKLAKKPSASTIPSDSGDHLETNVIAFAEQVGFLIGSVQAKAEGWLDRERLSNAIGQIRDNAAHLLEQLNAKRSPSKAQQPASPAQRARGPVDAPGKRHRKPPPQQPVGKRLSKPQGKRLTEKGAKTGRFRRQG